MAFFLDEDRFEPPLEDVTRPLAVSIDPLRVDAVEVAHASRQVRIGRFDQEMVVVGHQAVRVAEPPVPINCLCKGLKEGIAIRIGEEDLLTSVTTARDVVDGSLIFNPQWPCHATILHQTTPRMKT